MRSKHLLIFIFIASFLTIKGQNIKNEIATFQSQTYQKSRNMPWALKFESNGIVRDNAYFFNRYGLTSEFKLSKNVSLNASTRLFRQSRLLFQDALPDGQKATAWSLELAVEPRLHLSNNNNSFFGPYIGLRFLREMGYRVPETTYKILLSLGTQRFFYTSIFNNLDNAFDGSAAFGFSYQKNKGFRPAFQIYTLQGAILSDIFRKYKPNNPPPDRIREFQALTDQSFQVKFDLFNLITKADENDLVGEIRIGYEQKIAKSAFSINIEGAVSPSRLKNSDILRGTNDVTQSLGTRLSVCIEPRWYYNLEKRRKNGTSGNNLLGSYLGTEFLYQNQTVRKQKSNGSTVLFDAKNLTFTPLWGVQQQFSKRIFYDFKLGWGIRTVQENTRQYFKNYESNIYADILIGLKFGR